MSFLDDVPEEPETQGPDRSRLGRRSRRKGKAFERECAAMLRPVFGPQVKRGFQSRCGREGCDVEGTPYWVEAKHRKLVNVRAALRQAIEDTDGRPPVVIAKDDRSEPFVVMRLADWLRIIAGWRKDSCRGTRDEPAPPSPPANGIK